MIHFNLKSKENDANMERITYSMWCDVIRYNVAYVCLKFRLYRAQRTNGMKTSTSLVNVDRTQKNIFISKRVYCIHYAVEKCAVRVELDRFFLFYFYLRLDSPVHIWIVEMSFEIIHHFYSTGNNSAFFLLLVFCFAPPQPVWRSIFLFYCEIEMKQMDQKSKIEQFQCALRIPHPSDDNNDNDNKKKRIRFQHTKRFIQFYHI